MKLRFGYEHSFLAEIRRLKLSAFETVLIGSLVLMCLVSALSILSGKKDGIHFFASQQLKPTFVATQLKAVKAEPVHQELMALHVGKDQ
jgi:hypothetical protein